MGARRSLPALLLSALRRHAGTSQEAETRHVGPRGNGSMPCRDQQHLLHPSLLMPSPLRCRAREPAPSSSLASEAYRTMHSSPPLRSAVPRPSFLLDCRTVTTRFAVEQKIPEGIHSIPTGRHTSLHMQARKGSSSGRSCRFAPP